MSGKVAFSLVTTDHSCYDCDQGYYSHIMHLGGVLAPLDGLNSMCYVAIVHLTLDPIPLLDGLQHLSQQRLAERQA